MKCLKDNCEESAVRNSNYCEEHQLRLSSTTKSITPPAHSRIKAAPSMRKDSGCLVAVAVLVVLLVLVASLVNLIFSKAGV